LGKGQSYFGAFPTTALDNGTLRIVVVPELGARVIALLDRRTGRDWLVHGKPPTAEDAARWRTEDVIFGGAEAFGWDECMPTVGSCANVFDPAASPLRDHGDLWGRPTFVSSEGGALVTTWSDGSRPYVFSRSLRLDDETLIATYRLANNRPYVLPILWALHALLSLEPGTRLNVPATEARVGTQLGIALNSVSAVVPWPLATTIDGTIVDLATVQGAESGVAIKLAMAAPADPVGLVTPDGSRLTFTCDRAVIGGLGVWLDYGGWPVQDGQHQVALEPETSPDEDLASAVATGRALTLPAHGQVSWQVRMQLQPADRM
jgi:hypothetical protein